MASKSAQPHKEHFLIIEDDKGTQQVLLKDSEYTLGRDRKCDICLHSHFVSRRHATLLKRLREDGNIYYQIIDGCPDGKPSANGLMINGRKVSAHDLKHGDEVVFGPQVIAVYQYRQRDVFPTIPPDDPFDITLIDPAMMVNDTEEKYCE